MLIEVFGPGCARCRETASTLTMALQRLGLDREESARVTKVENLRVAARRGVLMTPAVAIDGRLVSQGRVPTVDEAVAMIQASA